jgi:dihydrofolate synthase / folylpolyglutamate synthase
LGLDRIRTVLEALDNPQRSFRTVHVAGTNGKGSTCALIESALRHAGVRTGLYVSPHLVEPTERVQICGEPVSRDDFSAAFDEVHGACERLQSLGAIDMHTTYFETMTAMGFLLFRARGVDTGVVEVGMGGRLDATNVVDPELAVITPVDFDHEKYLGGTIPQIAAEKAGIIKPSRPVVFARQHSEALEVLETKARQESAPVVRATDWRIECLQVDGWGSRFRAAGHQTVEVECPLIGVHQVENARTAITALDRLGLNAAHIAEGIRRTRWPGRLERVEAAPDLFLDGAHNPAGARALAEYLRHFHKGRRIIMVFAAMQDKDLHALGGLLFPHASELIFTAPHNQPRAFAPEAIRAITGRADARCAEGPLEALAMARGLARVEDMILVTGSLYLVGEIRGALTL